MSLVVCSRCGGNVYEHRPPNRGLGKAVSRVTGCTIYSCYSCGRRGWLRHGRSNLGIAILARTIQGLILLFAALVTALVLFGVFMR